MKITFANNNVFDTFYELAASNKKLSKKIKSLIDDISRDPYDGIGKPEALKHEFSGWYSRRITDEHRLVYKVENDMIEILSCTTHYE
jgi:toxin YoeB